MLKKIILSILITCAFFACESTNESKEIVFVCTHGAARSPIAAAYFNKLANENNLNYHAVFKGTEPGLVLTKETIKGLTNDGFKTDNWKPEKVTVQDVEKAYKIVTFDCSVPSKKSSDLTLEWNGTPSVSKDYNIARDVIKNNVEQLIEDLKEK
ncbi:low molecular weight phosphatase family protein [Aquimarina sp. AU474]|uniref:arsenate-mycothiol transferase ArsC n=1 Tax=Aquimarina sp. AU474 TaxID=2108529 RepID=UPI000D699E9D|nr:hypothetical protein [Aquimarina sp. AU474]